jgi:hypothetical protein
VLLICSVNGADIPPIGMPEKTTDVGETTMRAGAVQLPIWQDVPGEQTRPQPPQLLASVKMFVSQPSS